MSQTRGNSVDPRPTFGLGLTSGEGPDDYQIAIRVQSEALLGSARVEAVVAAVGGEADVQFVGIPRPFSGGGSQPLTDRARPLVPGCSISTTTEASAGTLGCFVVDDESTYLLSNSHVIADFGSGHEGLPIVQPGRLDGGSEPADVVASLGRAVPVDPASWNLADAAIAHLESPEFDTKISGIGAPGQTATTPDIGDHVAKRGRTTSITAGTIRATHVNLKIDWPDTLVEFTDLVEIVADNPADAFGAPGDSGSLIVATAGCSPVALLMAGGPVSGGVIVVYAVPMTTVLRELGVRMA
jgi:hypothetical protein